MNDEEIYEKYNSEEIIKFRRCDLLNAVSSGFFEGKHEALRFLNLLESQIE